MLAEMLKFICPKAGGQLFLVFVQLIKALLMLFIASLPKVSVTDGS